MIHRVLIANRGEIALRIIRGCRSLGIESVLAVSTADKDSLPAQLADRTVVIGAAPAMESYLDITRVVSAALGTDCDAVHPGYGFLSENAEFAQACIDAGLIFVGPSPDVLRKLGDKLTARHTALAAGVNLTPGAQVSTPEEGLEFAAEHGYPQMLKAVSGGGGRGIRVVRNDVELERAVPLAQSEAQSAFNDERVYIEPYIVNGRHIEVQILRDKHGNTVALGERDCSLQRRHQKVIEESPAPNLSEQLRSALYEDAKRISDYVEYVGAATVEFLVDSARERHYFLEVNARIQVEHPVTEAVMDADLIGEQLRIANGDPISDYLLGAVSPQRWAIEARVNCEDPRNNFMPSPGRISVMRLPGGPGIRVDTYCEVGSMVPPYYDSMIAKVIASGRDREEALIRLRGALGEIRIEGISHNVSFLLELLEQPDFVAGAHDTQSLTRYLEGAQDTQGAGS